jgi:hypothetical protein
LLRGVWNGEYHDVTQLHLAMKCGSARRRVRTGVTEPSGRGGVASTIVPQPARPAGVHSMSALDGRTAVPPGTYTPTAPAAR